ncbi:MAG: SLC13 family permease [Thaumarchaeota archaeon]|nr:SLC13 family permease [Nitrososphaerota archaeon]
MSSTILQQLDLPVYLSLAFLFGIASQFRAMNGESFLRRITAIFEGRIGMLYAVVVVTSLFSPLILNDVVILILTPVVISYARQSQIDVAPLVVAEITFTNIASSLTPLGNPQNILLWSSSGATFLGFISGTWIPLLISACIAVVALLPLRKSANGRRELPFTAGPIAPGIYLVLVIAVIIVSDVSGVGAYIALGVSFALGSLFTFRSLPRVLHDFDYRSLLILYAFVTSITIASIFIGPALGRYVAPVAAGVQPYSALFMGGVSSIISNVPATQLVLSVTSVSPQVAPKIAVEAGLAGNIDPVASFANILALLMVRRAGLPIRRAILLQFFVGIVSFLPALL